MKKNDIFDAFERLDPKFVEEAAPNINKKARKPLVFRLVAIAACIALLVTGVVVGTLLLNRDSDQQDATDEIPDRIKEYQDSEYFEVIKTLDAYFEEERNRPDGDGILAGTVPGNVQITDNQTHGVEEADKIKRTDTHIFYMDGQYLRAFTIDGENSSEVGSYKVSSSLQNEFFLTEDGKTVIVISDMDSMVSFQPGASTSVSYVDVLALDVSNPANIKKKTALSAMGGCLSARLVEGKLLMFIRYWTREELIRFSDPLTFMPSIDRGNGYELLPNQDIIYNEKIVNSVYTIALMFDADDLALEKNITLLSYWNEPYVSEDKIFFSGTAKMEGNRTTHTNILAVDYSGENFEVLGSATVRGVIKDQWSMDEHEGVLRVVTTTQTSADLYCISLESFEEIASVKDFAPEKERVQSVRFDGNSAYVCTAINRQNQIIDPVFFFDLSDLDNITYKDTGTIEGMSTSLIDYGNGYLIGIGIMGLIDWNAATLKIEVYKESDNRVVSACKYEINYIHMPTIYKAYYVDRRNQLIGFGYYQWNEEVQDFDFLYALIKFDAEKEQLIELITVDLDGHQDNKRGVYIDGYMYMFGENDYKVVPVDLNNIYGNQPDTEEIPDEQP